jgi:hypothetical protein
MMYQLNHHRVRSKRLESCACGDMVEACFLSYDGEKNILYNRGKFNYGLMLLFRDFGAESNVVVWCARR